MSRRLDLMPDGPLSRIDRAIGLVRHAGLETALLGISAGALPALMVLAAFWLERVEGLFDLRPLLAAGIVVSFGLRSALLASTCRRYVRTMWPGVEIPAGAGSTVSVFRTAFVVSLGLAVWGAVFVGVASLAWAAVPFIVPFLALRGLFAPGWLARVACTEEGGLRAIWGAMKDNGHQRGEGFVVESLLAFAALGLAIDLFAATGLAVFLSRALLGLDLALLDQFLSARNTFTMLGTVLAAFALLEPLRAALSAIVFVDARVRSEGLDVRAAIEAALEHGTRSRYRPKGAAAAAVALLVLVPCASALAQPPDPTEEAAVEPSSAAAIEAADLARDEDARARTRAILARPEYREFSDDRGLGLGELLARWLEELFDGPPAERAAGGAGLTAIPLPGPGVFIAIAVVLALAVGLYLFLSRSASVALPAPKMAPAQPLEDPRERAPEDWLAQAAQMASDGRYREALRSLYLATLVALDRQQVLSFDPTLTNWQYLRQIQSAGVRSDFRELTRIFDHKWYGREATDQLDFDVCRQLAERMVKRRERGEAAGGAGPS